jgi:hypothetical protein
MGWRAHSSAMPRRRNAVMAHAKAVKNRGLDKDKINRLLLCDAGENVR